MFNIIDKKGIFFTIPAVIILLGVVFYFINGGFNADIDFTGGYTMAVKVVTSADPDATAQVDGGEALTPAEGAENPAEAAENAEAAQGDESTDAAQGGEAAENPENASAAAGETAEDTLVKTQLVVSDKTPVKDTYEFNENEVRDVLKGIEGVTVSSVVKSEDGFVLKLNELDTEHASNVKTALADHFGRIRISSEDKVSATVGAELWRNAITAVVIAALLMLVYITFRFELLSGLSAVLALVHDLLIMLSIYAIFQLPVGTSFIAALLTILGYSINATIVVFDRIRENTRYLKKESFKEIANKSIWQSMTRAINTSVTTLLTIVMVYILGVTSVRQFALPIIIGIICGTYSSVFLASSFWTMFRGDKKAKI